MKRLNNFVLVCVCIVTLSVTACDFFGEEVIEKDLSEETNNTNNTNNVNNTNNTNNLNNTNNTSDGTPICGDGVVEGDEVCDATDFAGETCQTAGFDSGELACNTNCMESSTINCKMDQFVPFCGNGVVEGNESCDGTDVADSFEAPCDPRVDDMSCVSTCVCSDSCKMECNEQLCGNSDINGGEVCDSTNFGGETCQSFGFDSGSLSCADQCTEISTESCQMDPVGPFCGDGKVDPGEECDGDASVHETCSSLFGEGMGGTVTCSPTCFFFVECALLP